MKPGIHTMSAAEYHADPCQTPSLSSGIAKLLMKRSPLHAWQAHVRLGGAGKAATRAMNDGSLLHRLILGVGADIEEINAEDWRTRVAKEKRDDAICAGRIPVLSHRLVELERAAEAALMQMRDHPDCQDFFAPGQSEAVVTWQEGDAWCRAMVDRLPDDPSAPPYDLKTTEQSAAPEAWERRLQTEYAIQGAFYVRGLRAIGRRPQPMRFVVFEMEPPHALSVMASAPSLAALAADDVEQAINRWGACLARQEWPGYAKHTAWVEAPNWMLRDAEDRALRGEIIREMAA